MPKVLERREMIKFASSERQTLPYKTRLLSSHGRKPPAALDYTANLKILVFPALFPGKSELRDLPRRVPYSRDARQNARPRAQRGKQAARTAKEQWSTRFRAAEKFNRGDRDYLSREERSDSRLLNFSKDARTSCLLPEVEFQQ